MTRRRKPRPGTPSESAQTLGTDAAITRRDFLGGTLIGSGAALLGMVCPARAQGLTDAWDGFAGVGDYARSNGNVSSVVNAAHGIRDGQYEAGVAAAPLARRALRSGHRRRRVRGPDRGVRISQGPAQRALPGAR